jgi:hypothetical protein
MRTRREFNLEYILLVPVLLLHSVSVIKTSQLMLYSEIIAVLRSTQNTQIHCGQNVEFMNVKLLVCIVSTEV